MSAERQIDMAFFRARLLRMREELTSIEETSDAAAEPVKLDQTRVGRLSRMDAMQAQAMSIDAKRRREQMLRKVAAALARIDSDDYGYCVDCDEPIDPRRLQADPTVTTCITCAGRRES